MIKMLTRSLENSFALPQKGLVSTVSFSSSACVLQNPNHRLYPIIDWDKVSGGNYAVVDPADTAAILYLSERDYKIQLRVSLSSDSPLVVLARAGEVPLTQVSKEKPMQTAPSSTTSDPKTTQNTPPKGDGSEPTSWDEALRQRAKAKRFMGKLIFWAKSGFSPYVKPGRQGDETLVTVDKGNFTTLFSKWATLALHWVGKGPASPAQLADVTQMANYLLKILEHQGASSMIKHMKLSSVAIRRFLSGNPVKDSWELEIPMKVCANGLPSWLPVRIRRAIASESTFTLRWIFTLLNQYKGFKCSYKPMDLSNITAPHPEISADTLAEFQEWCETYWKRLIEKVILGSHKRNLMDKTFLRGNQSTKDPFMPVTAGPNCSVSLLGSALDTYAWGLQPVCWLKEYLKVVVDTRCQRVFDMTAEAVKDAYPNVARSRVIEDRRMFKPSSVPTSSLKDLSLGKLALKLEAAGKKRIFAIPDYWTQRALKPLHTWMMDVLSVLPSDATFDQNGATSLFASAEKDAAHSYDLKAATDTIPQELYRIVFKTMLPAHLVDVWMMLLTDRWFKVPPKEKLNVKYVQYSRGQPMGALSSWPSMAIVHHAIVQFSAHKAGVLNSSREEFWTYRILGDDVVIGNGEVGRAYTEVCEALHVKIGRKVSLVSDASVNAVAPNNKVVSLAQVPVETPDLSRDRVTYRKAARRAARGHFFEFANQFWLGNVNVSPMSFKQEIGINTVAQRIEFAIRSSQRWPAEAGQSWVAKLVRYLLPPREYGNSVEAWRKGQLGAACQASLIAAFGPIRDIMSRIGFQWSSIRPLLLAFANSSTVIGGDQRLLMATLSQKERELLDLLFLRHLVLFRAQVQRMYDNALVIEDRFSVDLYNLLHGPCDLKRIDAKDGSRPNWKIETARTYLSFVLEDHTKVPAYAMHPKGFMQDIPKRIEEDLDLYQEFLSWSKKLLVVRSAPPLIPDGKVESLDPPQGVEGNLPTVSAGDGLETVQTALVPYAEGGALVISRHRLVLADPFDALGDNLRDQTGSGEVISLPPPTDTPLYEAWLKGEDALPPLYSEADFSELCERFAKLLPPVEISVDAFRLERETPDQTERARKSHARDLEAMSRVVGSILPVIQQVGFSAILADGYFNPEPTEALAGDRYPHMLTKKPLR